MQTNDDLVSDKDTWGMAGEDDFDPRKMPPVLEDDDLDPLETPDDDLEDDDDFGSDDE